MGFNFKPLSNQELNDLTGPKILEEGIYKFKVLKSKRTYSKAGNDMCELQLKIYRDNLSAVIFDYLVFSDVPFNILKVNHFCDSTGLFEQYKKGDLQEDLSGLEGYVKISIKPESKDSYGRIFPKRNVVHDYIKQEIPKEVADVFFNDDVKF